MRSSAYFCAFALPIIQAIFQAESAKVFTYFDGINAMMEYVPLEPIVSGHDLSAFLNEMHSRVQISGVQLAPGEWYVTPSEGPGGPKASAHISLTCNTTRTAPFTISLAGSYIRYMNSSYSGISLSYCVNVTVSGPANFSYVQDQLPHMESRILAIDDSNPHASYRVQVFAAYVPAWERMLAQYPTDYPLSLTFNGFRGDVYDANTGRIKFLGGSCLQDFVLVGQVLNDNNNVYNLTTLAKIVGAEVGDILVVKQPELSSGISVFKSGPCTFKDLHLFTVPGVTFNDYGATGQNSYLNMSISPDPIPGPDGHVAVLSSNADGLHYANGNEGPLVQGCRFEATGDDTINIQSSFSAIVAVDPASHSVTVGGHLHIDLFAPGDNVTIYMADGVSLGTALIGSVTEVPSMFPPGTTVPLFNNESLDGADYLKLVLAPYPANITEIQPMHAFLSQPSREGAGFVITDNYFAGNRGRGVHAGSNRGVIARNKIVDVCYAGVSMNPDASYTDANFASNILVQSNFIDTPTSGVLLFTGGFAPDNWVNKNISVLDNTINNAQTVPLQIASAQNVTVAGNTFHNCFCFANTTDVPDADGSDTPPYTPIVITNSTLVTFANNNFTQDSDCQRSKANYTQPVYVANTTQVSGLTPPPAAAAAEAYLQAPYPNNHTGVADLG